MKQFRVSGGSMTPHLLKAASKAALRRKLAKQPFYQGVKNLEITTWLNSGLTVKQLITQLNKLPSSTRVLVPSAGTHLAGGMLHCVRGLVQMGAQPYLSRERASTYRAVCLESAVR